MKSYLQTKLQRFGVNMHFALYTNLILILMSLLLIMIVPLFRQPIPLHQLANIKTNTATIAPIIITIHHTGHYHLNTEIKSQALVSLDELKGSLLKQFQIMAPNKTSICIQSDLETPYGQVLAIIDWLQEQGAQYIGLLTTNSTSSQASL